MLILEVCMRKRPKHRARRLAELFYQNNLKQQLRCRKASLVDTQLLPLVHRKLKYLEYTTMILHRPLKLLILLTQAK